MLFLLLFIYSNKQSTYCIILSCSFVLRVIAYFPVKSIEIEGNYPFIYIFALLLFPIVYHYYNRQFIFISTTRASVINQYFMISVIILYWTLPHIGYSNSVVMHLPILTYIHAILYNIFIYIREKDNRTRIFQRLFCLIYVIMLTQGPYSTISNLLYFVFFYLLSYLFHSESDICTKSYKVVLLIYSTYYIYYIGGNAPRFNQVHYFAAFIGFEDFNMIIGFLLVLFNVYGCWMVYIHMIRLLDNYSKEDLFYYNVFIHGTFVLFTLVAAFILRFHCFIANIFLPKSIFDICCFLFNSILCLL